MAHMCPLRLGPALAGPSARLTLARHEPCLLLNCYPTTDSGRMLDVKYTIALRFVSSAQVDCRNWTGEKARGSDSVH
jgi:hypothetical protein